MFNKIVIIEPINMLDEHLIKLNEVSKEVIYYKDIPSNDDEIIKRINDADAVCQQDTQVLERAASRCYKGFISLRKFHCDSQRDKSELPSFHLNILCRS